MEKYKLNARAKRNGIVFYSSTCPLIGSETFRDESGEIQTRLVHTQLDGYMDYLGTLNEIGKTFTKKKVLAFDIILIAICLLLREIDLAIVAVFFSVTISFQLFQFIELSYQMKSKKGKNRSTARYHAAEHMVINAYRKLKRIPTFEEVKKSSRFSTKCGSRTIINNIVMYSLVCLAMVFVAKWNFILYLLVIVLIPIFRMLADKKGWLKFLQVFITEKPSDAEIKLAIEGIKNYEAMEEKINEQQMEIPEDFPIIIFLN